MYVYKILVDYLVSKYLIIKPLNVYEYAIALLLSSRILLDRRSKKM